MEVTNYKNAIVAETKRRIIEESISRINTCLEQLSDEQVWYRPNKNSNSVGNLILHLCGNARQWIIHGLDGQYDVRSRELEFSEIGPLPKKVLSNMMEILATDLEDCLSRIVHSDLLEEKTIQVHFKENGVSILIHVIEHFSYHTGQITYYTKMVKDIDTGYYKDLNL